MGKPLRVLIVEDSEDDAELVRHELRRSGYDPTFERIDTPKAMNAALDRQTWDIILSDYVMPHFSGLAALELLQKKGLDLPFIVVSGKIGEETAVAAMRAGAHDYIMKGNLARLVPAIERELVEAEVRRKRKRAEEEMRDSEEKFRTISASAQDAIIMRDNKEKISYWNEAAERIFGYSREEATGKNFHELVIPDRLHEDYFEQFKVFKETGQGPLIGETQEVIATRRDGTEFPIELSISAVKLKGKWNAIGIMRDISERKQVEQAQEERRQSLEKLRKALGGTIQAMAATLEARDPYTSGHQQRVAALGRAVAEEMGLPEGQVDGVRIAGIIHDTGKIAVPAEILTKPSRLTRSEFEIIKTHPRVGHDILKGIEFPWPVAQILLQHHERMDGSGYPNGLSGEEILLEARIIGGADVVEAMSSHRPYRPALGVDKALEEISQNKGTLYDANVVDACVRLFTEKGFELKQL
ncbi:MAG: HD domain-containing phosphohydrolase [Candidatus Brocadiales bacterium]